MSDVFISYSRQNTGFVWQLHEALAAHDRNTWADWEDIPLSAEWRSEIKAGLEVGGSSGAPL